jgi:ribosomal protein S17E
MGRIKSKLVKRTGLNLLKEENVFTDKFDDNKDLVRGITPSKKIRNQIAGYITRKKKTGIKVITTSDF